MLKFLKSKTAKTVGGLMLAVGLMFSGNFVAEAALTTSQVNAIIGLLNSFGADATTVANVQASLTGSTPVVTAPSTTTYDFGTATLRVGSKGEFVKNLQMLVGTTPDGDFGSITKAKVMAWQTNNGLEADGLFGPASRAKANAVSSVVTNPPVVATGPVVASLAMDNPASSTVLESQALADLAHFTFTGTGTISQISLQRTGLSVSADVSNVYLFDGNTRLTDGASINNAGVVTFNNTNIAINGSRTISVRADIASSTSSVSLGVALTSYITVGSTSPVVTNIAGNLFTVSTAALTGRTAATSNTDALTLVANASVNAGTMGYTVWSNSISVSGRDGLLKGLNLHFIGSAPTDSLSNAKVYLDGTEIGSGTVGSNGYLMFDLGTGVNLSVSTHSIDVRADIIKGSNRNFQFSLQNASDLMIVDSQLGININASSAVSNGSAGTISVNAGSVTVTTDPSFNAVTDITGGATNVTLAKYKFTAYGEDMKITSLTATPAIAGSPAPATTSMNNVALYANGGQIGSSQNYVATALVYSLGSSLIIPAGTTTIVEVRADTINATPANYTAGTVTVTLAGSTNNAQGMSSQNLTTAPSTGGVAASILTMGAATANITVSTALNSQNVVANTTGTKIGSYVLAAGTTEGVRVTNLQVGVVVTTFGLTNISNLYTSEDMNNIIGSPSVTNNFPVSFTIAPGSSKVIDIYADLGAATSGTVQSTVKATVIGSTTNVALTTGTGIASAQAGQTMTLAAGSVATPTKTTASMNAQFVIGGASSDLATLNFVASNGDATITELRFAVTGTSTAISSIRIGTVTTPVVGGIATVTGLSIAVPVGYAGTDVVVTPTFNLVGLNQQSSNADVIVTLNRMKYTVGNTPTTSGTLTVAANTMKLVATKPAISVVGSTDTLSNASVKLLEVTVSADAAGDLKLTALPITVTSTGLAAITSAAVVVKDTAGTTVTTTGTLAVVAGASGSATIAFTNGYLIPKGTSKTFRIYATVSGVTSVNTSLSSKLGVSSSMTWSDVSGNATGITGANIANYPTDTFVVDNF